MNLGLREFKITRFEFPRNRRIGDSQVLVPDTNWVGALELMGADGHSGLGFFAALFDPLPSARFLTAYFDRTQWPHLRNQVPEALLNRVTRPRGGNIRSVSWDLGEAVELALWDLAAKRLNMPLFRLLGGTRSRQRAYASGLCFHLTDDQTQDFYAAACRDGYTAYKVKVGHPDLGWDLNRLKLISEAVGTQACLMVDANEAWAPHEARRRLQAYTEAGFRIYWVEDPLLRHDFVGLRELRRCAGPVMVNAGEYLSPDERLQLLAARAIDIMNLNGGVADGLRVARACAAIGVPVTIGNTMMNVGAHLGAALPEVDMVEDSRLDWNNIVRRPIPVIDGHYVLSETPGHGLELSAEAVRDWARPAQDAPGR